MLFSLLLLHFEHVVIAFMQVIWKECSVCNSLTDFKWVVVVLLLYVEVRILPFSFLWRCYCYVRFLCCLSWPCFLSLFFFFFRMIDWLSWPLANHVDTWVIALLKGLAAVQKFTILIDVTLLKIEQVCVYLLIKELSKSHI